MAIITIDKLSLAFGHHQLFNKISFSLEKNDKYGLIGRNGAGKSSLLKVLGKLQDADEGNIYYQEGIKIAYVPQEPQLNPQNSIFDEVLSGLGVITQILTQYYSVLENLARGDEQQLEQLAMLQQQLEQHQGWNVKNLIDKILSELGLNGPTLVADLFGGMSKKVALAKALVNHPTVLLLDEPTNHLDVYAIEWLEQFLYGFSGAIVLITHDRQFLDNSVTKILELDRGGLRTYTGNFSHYQAVKTMELEQEALHQVQFDKLLAQEEAWIRKGIEARRTRNEGRVRRLEQLRIQRAQRREVLGQVRLQLDGAQLSGNIVATLKQLTLEFGDKKIIDDFSTIITRGDKIGLIGPNGCGKTTLLKAILGEIQPKQGMVSLGTKLEVAYFDQLREQLPLNKTIQEVVANGQDFILINGVRRHIASYLEDFLFAPARFRSPVSSLSGGERNRLLLALLFAKPANLLVLDEPTNDLDMDTLELLEELLNNYLGTVFLVSHDRKFMDNVVTSSWVFQGGGKILELQGGYSEWSSYSRKQQLIQSQSKVAVTATAIQRNKTVKPKLSYKEKQELEELPKLLQQLEQEQAHLNTLLLDSNTYVHSPADAANYCSRVAAIEELLLEKLARWEELEAKNS
jgi:ATP-binding cassette subfamily F protein uup